ncbi:MAG: hypothetical protein ACKVP2_15260 [Burkholderiales bacterium]
MKPWVLLSLLKAGRFRYLKAAIAVGGIALLVLFGLGIWAVIAAIGWVSNQAPPAWAKLTGQIPDIRKSIEGVMPEAAQAVENWIPGVTKAQKDVAGEDVGSVARYKDFVRTRYSTTAESRLAGYEGRGEFRAVADFYRARFSEKGWSNRVIDASVGEERHQYLGKETRVELHVKDLGGGNVSVIIEEWAAPKRSAYLPGGAMGKHRFI